MLFKLSEKNHEIAFSAVGNVLSWYCYALFMPFFTIISKVFFRTESGGELKFLAFLAFSAALFTRPLGASIFGPIGDEYGRRKSIMFSIILMSLPTLLIAFMPSYASIGIMAPIIIIICRGLQGISMGGEYAAAMIHLVEQAPNNLRGFYGCLVDAGTQIGIFLGSQSLVFLCAHLSEPDLESFGWRIPFFCGILLIPVAFMVPKEKKVVKAKKTSIKRLFTTHRREMIHTMSVTAFSAISFYTLIAFLPIYFTSNRFVTLKEAAQCSVSAAIVMTAVILSVGYCERIKRRNIMAMGILGSVAISYCIFLQNSLNFSSCLLLSTAYGAWLGVYYSHRSAFFTEAFPRNVRCTAVAISIGLSQAIFGAVSPAINMAIATINHNFLVIPVTLFGISAIYSLYQIRDRTGETLE